MDVFDLYAKLSLDSSGYDRALNDAAASGNSFSTKMVLGLKTAGTAVVNVVKKAVDSYGEYEQLVGGVETLFKTSSGKVQKYAANAYKTAGLSANQYMNTAIGFSGALLKSLGGDTEKAADLTQTAITDMADQANKYGKTVQEVSGTYTSLARGNFQTLDNLFGGMFAGTKSGLNEMLRYAEKYRKSLGETVHYSADSYADIVSAIHDVSVATGVYETTLHEAEGTIQGSAASVKASWENLITGISDENADLVTLFGNLFDSIGIAAGNIVPRVEQALYGLADSVSIVIPEVIKKIPDIIEKLPEAAEAGQSILTNLVSGLASSVDTVVPQLTEGLNSLLLKLSDLATNDSGGELAKAGNTLLSNLAKAMVNAVPQVLTTLTEVITNLTNSLGTAAESADPYGSGETALTILRNLAENLSEKVAEVLPNLTSAASAFISAFAGEAANNTTGFLNTGISILNTLITNLSGAVPQVMSDITSAVMDVIDAIIGVITGLDSDTFLNSAVTLVTSLADGITQSVDVITEKLPELITGLVAWLTDPANLIALADSAVTIFLNLVSDVPAIVESLATGLGEIVTGIVNYFTEHGDEISDSLKTGLSGIGTKVQESWENDINPEFDTMGENIKAFFLEQDWAQNGIELIKCVVNGITSKWAELKSSATSFVEEIKSTIQNLPSEALTWGTDLINNFVSGITQKWEELKQSVANVAQTVKDFLGFSEPKEGPLSNFHTYAPDMMELFAKGINDNKNMLMNTVADTFDLSNAITDSNINIPVDTVSSSDSSIAAAAAGDFGGWTINVYGAQGMNEETLARMVASQVRDKVVSIGALG